MPKKVKAIDKQFYALVHPDGSIDPASLSGSVPQCIEYTKTQYKVGTNISLPALRMKGYTFERVNVKIEPE